MSKETSLLFNCNTYIGLVHGEKNMNRVMLIPLPLVLVIVCEIHRYWKNKIS